MGPSRQFRTLSTFAALFMQAAAAPAHTRWIVDPTTSLAWWQMSPNLGHLWATTCPADPSWRPGGGRDPGWNLTTPDRSTTGFSNREDTVHVPLYPRRKVRHLCGEAVRGEVVADTNHWGSVHGNVTVRSEALVGGEELRDALMRQVLEIRRYPEIVFTLDSLVDMTRRGDTLAGSAVGVLTVRDQQRPVTAAIEVFPDSSDVRVLAKWRVPAIVLHDLTPGLRYLNLGLDSRIWKDFFMGADLVLRPEGAVP